MAWAVPSRSGLCLVALSLLARPTGAEPIVPPGGTPPLLVQPEGVAVDAVGNLYVADRAQGAIVRLDAAGGVLDPRYVTVLRPRLMATGDSGLLWIGSDGTAEAPWQRGVGEI